MMPSKMSTLLLLFVLPALSSGFLIPRTDADLCSQRLCLTRCSVSLDTNDEASNDTGRRAFLYTSLASTALWTNPLAAQSAWAAAAAGTTDTSTASLDCLRDLPAYDPATTVRLYLCRHGETEYNRLKIVQGARVDAPLNDMGRQQATLLGQALCRTNPVPSPTLFVHSPLRRAQQTAQLASVAATNSLWPRPRLRRLDSLAEVDFGAVAEGTPVSSNRAQLVALYTAWAMGNLEARMSNDGTGESGTQILARIDRAVQTMVETAALESSSSLVAVAHSAYLRLLLGAVTGFGSFSATSLQGNCCVNVLDFARPIKTRSTSLSTTNPVPRAKVIRVNETRHLSSLPMRPSALAVR